MSMLSKLAVAASIADFAVKKFFFDLLKIDTVAATGSLISDAEVLSNGRNVVTAANGTKAVRLPKSLPDSKVEVVNTSATQALIVFPELAGDQINAITAGESLSMPGGSSASFYCDAAGHWYAAIATAATADTAELAYLDGALTTNLVASKTAILGTGGALTLGGALTAVTSIGIGSAVLTEAELEMLDTLTGGAATASKAVVLDADKSITGLGSVTSTAPTGGGIGYATGAGGAVSQLTDRITGVVLSKLAGQITTHNASLAAEAAAEFTVTNTTVAIGDVVVVAIQSGTNGGNTNVFVSTVAAGSFKIKVANDNAAGGTAETGAIIINFAVIKSVAA